MNSKSYTKKGFGKKSNFKPIIPYFQIKKPGKSARVRFLSVPYHLQRHNMWALTAGRIKGYETCTAGYDGSCFICDNFKASPSFIAIFPLIDTRKEEYEDKDGNTVIKKDSLKILHTGRRFHDIIATVLKNDIRKKCTCGEGRIKKAKSGKLVCSAKCGSPVRCDLTTQDCIITRYGEGKDTQYVLTPDWDSEVGQLTDDELDKLNGIDLEKIIAPSSAVDLEEKLAPYLQDDDDSDDDSIDEDEEDDAF